MAAACALGAIAACFGASSRLVDAAVTGPGAASSHRTALLRYSPFANARPASRIVVAKTVRGYCWTSALTDWRSAAWRCFGPDSSIHDPCFSSPIKQIGYVLCPTYTPISPVLRINLAKQLPTPVGLRDNTLRRPPWSVQLDNGVWCISRGGINGIPRIHGKDVSYVCQRGTAKGSSQFGDGGELVGPLHRSPSGWTTAYAIDTRVTTVGIRSAWW